MIRFSARGPYLALVPQGRAVIHIQDRALMNILRIATECTKQGFNVYLIRNNSRNIKYAVNVQLICGNH